VNTDAHGFYVVLQEDFSWVDGTHAVFKHGAHLTFK